MRLLSISQCKPGMRLAKKIFSEDGIVLLGEGIELTARLITRLTECNVHFLYIEDKRTEDLNPRLLIGEETFQIAIREIRKNFSAFTQPPIQKGKNHRPYIAKPLKDMMNLIIQDLSSNKDAMIMLLNMGTVDHYLYQHSLNVCVYSTLLAMSHGYSQDELINLGMGALLHDIGKTQISTDILKKPESLTELEYQLMKEHTVRGFELLKDEPNLSLSIAHCAFQHHERIDGSGYPRGLKGPDIMEYARWIGIVDSYDAMTTSRVYSTPMLPHEATERLYAGSGTLFEQWMLTHFRDKVVIYPIGITVKINTGEVGVVVDYNSTYPHRPVIRILTNEAGEDLTAPYEIDMSKKLNIMITSVNGNDINFHINE